MAGSPASWPPPVQSFPAYTPETCSTRSDQGGSVVPGPSATVHVTPSALHTTSWFANPWWKSPPIIHSWSFHSMVLCECRRSNAEFPWSSSGTHSTPSALDHTSEVVFSGGYTESGTTVLNPSGSCSPFQPPTIQNRPVAGSQVVVFPSRTRQSGWISGVRRCHS